MMKQIFIIFTLLIGFIQVNGQWYQVNTNTTENLYDIFFVDSLEGYCVGGSDDNWGTPQSTGVVLKTIDGGENWTTIFSKDSLTVKSIAVVEESGNDKLYAFGLKNGISYLVSTFINTPFQNWSVSSISYKPKSIKVYNNEIFFIDEIDWSLKKISNNQIYPIKENVGMYNINSGGIITLNIDVDNINISLDWGMSWYALQSFPSDLTPNQLNFASIAKFNDTIIIKTTYPENIIYSFDHGANWNSSVTGGPIYNTYIFNTDKIYGYSNDNHIYFTNNFGNTWIDFGYLLTSYLYNSPRFLVAYGDNGIMAKNHNLVLVDDDQRNLKKKINIYPNPAKGILQIEVSDNSEIESIELFDIGGKKVKTYHSTDRNLNISGLSIGTYFLRISTTKGTLTKKVVIE